MQTCVIFNPSARGEKAEVFCSKIASLYPNSVVRRTAAQGHARTSNVKLASDSRVLVQWDGENLGELPVTFSILPKVLRVIAP